MRKIGLGGECPSCDEPVAVTELLSQEVIAQTELHSTRPSDPLDQLGNFGDRQRGKSAIRDSETVNTQLNVTLSRSTTSSTVLTATASPSDIHTSAAPTASHDSAERGSDSTLE